MEKKTLPIIWSVVLMVLLFGEIAESLGRSIAADFDLHKIEVKK
ncbi:hypothetical protein [Pedobacter roseus]|nr:hypothetical protein [Pedobacter roseus]